MRGRLETIVGAMFAGKTSELLKRILWAEHQGKRILVIKPKIDNRYAKELISTHNNLSHQCFSMSNWNDVNKKFSLDNEHVGDMASSIASFLWRIGFRLEEEN